MSLINYIDNETVVMADWLNSVDRFLNSLNNGVYLPPFQAGYVSYLGPDGYLAFNTNFIFGLSMPNPSGQRCPALLVGSGVPRAAILTDTVLAGTPGIELIIAAGETAAGSDDLGGALLLFGGGASNGFGGTITLQGGTSVSNTGGEAIVQGGNSTTGNAGDAFLIGGQTGVNGGNVHVIMTDVGEGTPGQFRIRVNSTILYTITSTGAIFIGGSNAGSAGQPLISGGSSASPEWANGYTGNIALAKLTNTGTQGNFAVTGGIITSYTAPT